MSWINHWKRAMILLNVMGVALLAGCLSVDIVPPTIVSTTPVDGAVGVDQDAAITVTFSEALNPAFVNTSSFILASGAGAVAGAVTFTGLTATFTPTPTLTANTLYTATITTGIKDFAGNPLTSDFDWHFTTGGDLPIVNFTSSAQAVDEGVGTVTVTATLNVPSGLNVTAPFMVGGTATGGLDHDLVDGAIVITAGSLTGSTTFTVADDALDEINETVVLLLETPTNATLGPNNRHTVTIGDDDLPSVAWTVNGQTINESPACPCPVTVTASLSSTSAVDVTVPYSVTGTATAAADYSAPAPSPLIIAAGDLMAGLTFTVLDDAQTESSEFVILTVGVPVNATLGTTVQHSLEIIDDE